MKFYDNIEKSYKIFGETAFKKMNINGKYETRINRPLYETIMICFEKYSLDKLMSKKDRIVTATEHLLNNFEFNDLISTATGNTTKTNRRLQMYATLLENIFEQ